MPQVIPEPTSSVCSTGKTPKILDGAFFWLCKEHWGDANNIEDSALRGMVYDPDPKTTKIWINMEYVWDNRVVQNRPAIVIKQNDMRPEKMTIGDLSHGGIDLPEGGEHFQVMNHGSHTIFCLSTQPLEAKQMGTEMHRFFQQWAPKLRYEFDLHRLQVALIGALGRLKEANLHYAVPVQITWAYQEIWQIKPEAPLLKQVAIEMQSDLYSEE